MCYGLQSRIPWDYDEPRMMVMMMMWRKFATVLTELEQLLLPFSHAQLSPISTLLLTDGRTDGPLENPDAVDLV